MKRLLIILLVVSLLLQSGFSAFAQDEADGNGTAGSAGTVFLPMVGQGDAAGAAADETPTAQKEPGFRPGGGDLSQLSSEQADKDVVTAAGVGGFELVSLIVTFDSSVDAAELPDVPNAQITHRYKEVLNGVSLVTNQANMGAIADMDGVTGVYPDQLLHLNTDASPAFLGAPTVWSALGGQESAGEGVVVGVLDTGIWPEHPSFADPDPSGKPYAPPPGGPRSCQFGSTVAGDAAFTCNNKLIGAYRFMATYDAVNGLLPNEFLSARDDNGHGTDTSSTAAGNAGVQASIFGVNRGVVSGIAPRAYVIMYKVCGNDGCYQSDSVAAIDQAIADGVNVINYSISGGGNPYADPVELAFLDAYDHGIFVAASAGNSGPGADTVDHRGPWVTTVAASTSNRQFVSTVSLTAANGDSITLQGASLMGGISTPTPVVQSPDPLCGQQAAGLFTGKIVVCDRGVYGRVEKGYNVLQAGGVGMLLRNTVFQDVETDNHFLPAVHFNSPAGDALVAFMTSHSGVMATFTPGEKAAAQGDVIAGFSSRGGPGQPLGVSKPDVTAPGVQILAGHSPMHVDIAEGPQGELFQAIAGTSMSSPHVAGAAALLKNLHPDWTPGQIKSALMTTAKTEGVVKEDAVTPATSFDDGSGRIDLSVAGNPGLTIAETGANFVAHRNDLWNANYPSIYHPALPGAITLQRTVKSSLTDDTGWEVKATAGADWSINVPANVQVPANGETTFDITIDARNVPIGQVRQGEIRLHHGTSSLHIPVTIVRRAANVALSKSCTPTEFNKKGSTACTITFQNGSLETANVTVVDNLPANFSVVNGSLSGATLVSPNQIRFDGTLAGAEPPNVAIAAGGSPAGGYLPLSLFGVPPISGVGDDTITNFNVPAFTFAGESWSSVGVSSNGYVVIGGGSGPDNTINNQNFPNPSRPNNVLAPFWTDLNPGAAGAVRIGTLTDGSDTWLVVDWQGVRDFSQPRLSSFQIWIGISGDAHPGEDISFAYGTIQSNGDGGFLSVGAENRFGNRGGTIYYNGTGTLPSNGTQLRVTSTPGTPGESHTITFSMTTQKPGSWQNCAEMTANLFQGIATSCVSGRVR